MLQTDPPEEDPIKGPLIKRARAEAFESLAGHRLRGQPGFGHLVAGAAKRMLRETHGIEWRTQAELNPEVFFD